MKVRLLRNCTLGSRDSVIEVNEKFGKNIVRMGSAEAVDGGGPKGETKTKAKTKAKTKYEPDDDQ